MSSVVIAMLSGALIALGAAAIWRDFARGRSQRSARSSTAVSPAHSATAAPAQRAAQRQLTHVAPAPLDTAPRQQQIAPLSPTMAPVPYAPASTPTPILSDLNHLIAGIMSEADDTGPEFERAPAVEAGWHALSAQFDTVAARVNQVIGQVNLLIGPAGEATWSYKNRGFGHYRRLRLNDPSIAWLRIELTGDRHVAFRLRAHRLEQALINATVEVPIDALNDVALTDALARCVKPAAQYAAWVAPKAEADRDHSAALWAEIAESTNSALQITNNAFRQVGAMLVPLAVPAYEPSVHRHRWPLSINVDGISTGLMLIERQPDLLEITTRAIDQPQTGLAGRRHVQVLGLTAHFLAENMAAAAWPAIAATRQSAGAA